MGNPISEEKMDSKTPIGPIECPFCKTICDHKNMRICTTTMHESFGKLVYMRKTYNCGNCGGELIKMSAME